jgi:hypothetical protein
MTFQPGAILYTQGFGSRPENVEVPHIDNRAPSIMDVNFYPIGKRWINITANTEYTLTSFTSSQGVVSAVWTLLGTNGGALNTLSDGSSTTVTPVSNNIQIAGTNGQIASTAGSGVITLSLIGPYTPTTYTAHSVLLGEGGSSIGSTGVGTTGQALVGNTGADPSWTGSPSFSGSVTAGTGLTVTSGGATVTAGGLTVTAGGESITGTTTINTTGAATTTIGTGGTGAVAIGNATGNTAVTGSLTASTTLTATLGAITATNGNLVLGTAGNKIVSTSVGTTTAAGANSFGTVALVGGTATVATTAVTAASQIYLTCQALGTVTVPSALAVTTKTAGTSFVILASQVTDTSTIAWHIIN